MSLLLRDCSPGTRVSLRVKVVEQLLICEGPRGRVCEILVADSSACALLMTSEKLSPGTLVDLVEVACVTEQGRAVLKVDLFSRVEPVEATEAGDSLIQINLEQNISWVERELIKQ